MKFSFDELIAMTFGLRREGWEVGKEEDDVDRTCVGNEAKTPVMANRSISDAT